MDELIQLAPRFGVAAFETLYIVALTLLIGGVVGIGIGLGLYTTRKGSLFENVIVFTVLNFVVNFFRPIPFLIFLVAFQPLARAVLGIGIGNGPFIFVLSIGASFAIGRIVEQNLLTVSPGVIEAARAAGAGPGRIIRTVVLPEALGPLILGYTFIFVAIVDMSALAGTIGGGGLGNFALSYGYKQFNPVVTWAAVFVIIILVQIVQFFGNWLSRKALRR